MYVHDGRVFVLPHILEVHYTVNELLVVQYDVIALPSSMLLCLRFPIASLRACDVSLLNAYPVTNSFVVLSYVSPSAFPSAI